jgi:rod shape-determining protein MreC
VATTRNRPPRLAVLGQSVRRPAASPFTSRSGSALRRRIVVAVLVVLSLALITASFRESSSGPLHDVQNAGAAALRPFEVVTERIARPFRDAWGWFDGLLSARSENERLRKENQALRQKYVTARGAQEKYVALQLLLDYQRGPEFPDEFRAVNTSVLGHAPSQFQQQITIAAGSDQGIREDDPVVTADGLVGKVTRVASDQAVVTLLTDATSAVAAVDLTTNARGVIRHGAGGGIALFFDRVTKAEVVEKEDIVVTAGTQEGSLPSVYPRGIAIGKITSFAQSDTDIYKRIQVEPFAKFSSLDAVAVLVPKRRAG